MQISRLKLGLGRPQVEVGFTALADKLQQLFFLLKGGKFSSYLKSKV